jgi:hypothetical protein
LQTLGITRFEDLVAHLDGLTNAARRTYVEREAVDFVATIRQRLVRINNHLAGHPFDAEPEVTPRDKTVRDTDDLIGQFGELTEAARGAGLPSTLTHYLHTARLRLRFTLRGQGGRRIVSRDERTGEAQLRWAQGQMEVEVVDSSAYGLGVVAKNPLAENTVVEVITEEDGRRRRYECLVVYSEQQRFQHQIGLEIFNIKQ